MKNFIREISNNIVSLNRYSKRLIAILTDISLCILCTWLAFVLRLEELILLKNLNLLAALISTIIAIPVFWLFDIYRTIFHYTSLSIIFTISASMLVYGFLYFLVISAYGLDGVPRSIGIIQPMLLFFAIISSRIAVKFLLNNNYLSKIDEFKKKKVLIYGAGDAGRQLVIALENNSEFNVEGFLDNNDKLHRQVLLGKKIYSPDNLEKLITKKK